MYPDFSAAHKNIWVRIFKVPFKPVWDTKLQTFQYKILQHIIPCNYCILYTKYYIFIQWLFNNNELDLYVCQTQVKLALNIDHSLCKKEMNIKSL